MSISVAANRSNRFNVPQKTLDQLKVTGTSQISLLFFPEQRVIFIILKFNFILENS